MQNKRKGQRSVLFALVAVCFLSLLQVESQDAVDPVPSDVGSLQKQLKAKEREVAKLLKKVNSLQEEKDDAVSEVQVLRSASKATDSTAKAELTQLKLQLEKKQQQLTEHQATCSAAEGQVEEAQKQVAHLTAELAQVRKAQERLESESDLTSKKASKALEELKQHLTAAEKDATESKAALAEAQASASDTLKQLNDIMGAWLPHWLSHRYEWATSSIKPQLDYAREKGGEYAALTSQHSAKLYTLSKAKSQEVWEAAGPSAQQAFESSQRAVKDGFASSKKFAAPHIATAQKHSKRAWIATKLHLNRLLVHPKVVHFRREAKAQFAVLEKAISKQLQQHPALRPYAKQPYLAYITWTAVALPIVIILLPILLCTGRRKAKPAFSESNRDLPAGVVHQDKPSTSSTGIAAKPRKTRGKRIVEGDEGVSFA